MFIQTEKSVELTTKLYTHFRLILTLVQRFFFLKTLTISYKFVRQPYVMKDVANCKAVVFHYFPKRYVSF